MEWKTPRKHGLWNTEGLAGTHMNSQKSAVRTGSAQVWAWQSTGTGSEGGHKPHPQLRNDSSWLPLANEKLVFSSRVSLCVRSGPMPRSRWSAQDKLNNNLEVGWFSLVKLCLGSFFLSYTTNLLCIHYGF